MLIKKVSGDGLCVVRALVLCTEGRFECPVFSSLSLSLLYLQHCQFVYSTTLIFAHEVLTKTWKMLGREGRGFFFFFYQSLTSPYSNVALTDAPHCSSQWTIEATYITKWWPVEYRIMGYFIFFKKRNSNNNIQVVSGICTSPPSPFCCFVFWRPNYCILLLYLYMHTLVRSSNSPPEKYHIIFPLGKMRNFFFWNPWENLGVENWKSLRGPWESVVKNSSTVMKFSDCGVKI